MGKPITVVTVDDHPVFREGIAAVLSLELYTAAQRLPAGDPTRALLTRSVDQAEELVVEGRQKLLGLRAHSQSRLELSQALAMLGLELSADTATTFSAVKKGRVRVLAAAAWDEVFSIAREAINNAFRHAGADHIEAVVTYGSWTLTVQIGDDGCGVPNEVSLLAGKPSHFGLRAMRERAEQLRAEFVIGTVANRGTNVSLVVPGFIAYLRRSAAGEPCRDETRQSLSSKSGVARLTSLHAVRIIATLSSSLRMSNMFRTPDSPAAPNAYAHARPTKHALAPNASAFSTSKPERMPPSINTGTRP
jgi:hypothetical protein